MPSFFKKKGPTQLFALIMHENWEDASSRAKHSPNETKSWTKVCIDGTHSSSLLPLHQACSLKPPVKAINSLIKAYPKAVRTKESFFFRLPLHIACLRGGSLDVINALLTSYPDGARAKAVFDRLPLHYACGSGASQGIIQSLIGAFPECPKTQDEHGWLPLHLACFYNADVNVVQTLINAFPDSVYVMTKKGKTPLQCIKLNKGRRNEKIIALLQATAAFRREARQQQTPSSSSISSRNSRNSTKEYLMYGLPLRRSSSSSVSSVESEYDFVPSDNEFT